ncbi:uncharacterized protein LOC119496787 [Sebastes umbrosus]|uniref:uncharacterized protein LOC119496787 n=1 Tax=Sebastes umbrosus TaxID=72105 RepID=UPI0018A065A5|nr:uncharacterized protein LOC119496787 [Sebastes umbrosus]XP_037640276.1 uncharacterized protein LOC119496787 [Sebastes umbrosus]
MSVTMTKAEGVTVITLTSDPQSFCPPLCQIFKVLCCNPVCCSMSQHLRTVQRTSQSVLWALHIMVGLLNIGLGAILLSNRGDIFPFWLGAVFVLFGIIGILSKKYPSPCLVIVNVILNLAGVGFTIAAIVLYSLNIAYTGMWWMCENYDYHYYSGDRHAAFPSPGEKIMTEKCQEGKELVLMLMRSMNVVLIVLSALELCLVISSAVLGIKALRSREDGEKKKIGDPELYKPLLEEVTSNPAA